MSKEYIIYCDESTKRGQLFSNFYGGLLVRSEHIDAVRRELENAKNAENLGKELKWTRITEQYEAKYLAVLKILFDLIERDIVKARVMFTQNIHVPILNEAQVEKSYFLLYYQFIKHAFGLRYSNDGREPVNVRVYADHIPHTKENAEQFKNFIANLSLWAAFRVARVQIRREDVTEIDSSEHVLAQCVDLILGAMQFRLNKLNKVIQEGQRVRGKRTRAKERVYDYIRGRANTMHRHFNIGISTGLGGDITMRWGHRYAHWRLIPKHHVMADDRRRRAAPHGDIEFE